ncbi:cytochrome b5, putative [Eimeria mitis]|uniref:Cytochrome b5, putative n=1 Tax=Eimeria mitis TaxID=44415 RepID=U6JZ32_9EIME|nr:cytochrome b5, putative [Eimeria mitis]CDJ29986.1 cytochrome b5, putative [Eimeria mitis]
MEDLLKLPEISWEEIKKHTDAQSCWCVFYGLVYDLTKFLKDHPGGHHVILEVAGQDATDSFEDIGHTLDARAMADEYLIGRVKGETNIRRCTPPKAKESSGASNSGGKGKGGNTSTSLIVVMVVVALIGIWAYYQFQDDSSSLYRQISTAPQPAIE